VTFDITPTSVSRAGVYVELDGNWYRELDTTASNSNATAGTSLSTGSTGTPGAALEVALAFFGADSAQNVDLTRAYNTGFTEVEFTGEASAGTPSAQVAVKPLKTAVAQACTFVTTDTGDQLLGIASIFGPPEIVEVGAVSNGELNVSATSGSITHGLDIQSGDFIVAIVHVNLGTNTIADNNGANSFTERIADRDHSAASSTYAVFDRVAGASEPATYSFNGWTAAEWSISLAVFRGVNTSDPYDIAWSTSNETSVAANTTLASANPSTSGANAKALLFAGSDSDPFTWGTVNNGLSERTTENTGRATALYSKTIDAAGSIGTTTLSWTGTNDMFTIMAALKPGGSAVTITDVANSGETPGSGTETWPDGSTGNVITGTGFM
jgi:hypothetical protein